ncbi:MAG: kynureninase [Planctomycetota bacterium]|jgi:kynureninase
MTASKANDSYKQHFSRFLAKQGEVLHFAAHSHHYWPDVTFDAQMRAWELAAEHIDEKWGPLLSEVLPRVQSGIAKSLNLSQPQRLALAPNTHEFLVRLISCFPTDRPVRILATDSEFHTFSRQCTRWIEAGRVELTTIPTAPFESFEERFLAAASEPNYDLVFASLVFFNSGFIFKRFAELASVVPDKGTPIVLDGYHSFMAVPVDLRPVEDRCFFLAGGYKYAMSGEGICFMHCPDGYLERPVNTGWFASFESLASAKQKDTVHYASGGQRFWGATFDPTSMLRMSAVFDLLDELNLTTDVIHKHVQSLQALFLDRLTQSNFADLSVSQLTPGIDHTDRGHFLTFRTAKAKELHEALRKQDVLTDFRDENLRFGFAIYHDAADVEELFERLQNALA